MLRWGSSIHNFRRTATEDTEIRGVQIKEGDKVVLYYAAANRDEEVFADPHTFDIGRTPNDHVTFGGGGVHYCLGASLAKAEIKATMRQIVERLPDLELLGREAHRAEDAEAAGLRNGHDHVAAVREGEDGELDPQVVADRSAHRLVPFSR